MVVKPLEGTDAEAKQLVIEYPRESLSYVTDEVTGAYLMGSNAIRVEGKTVISREDRSRLKSALARLIGLEIVDENSKGMTLQFLLDPAVLDPEKIVRRMSSLISGMLRDSAEGVKQDRALLALVGERDDEVDRLYFLLVRTIRTAAIDPEVAGRYRLEPIECLDYRVLASYLESLGDAITDFSRLASSQRFGKQVSGELATFLRALATMGETSVASFLARRRVQAKLTHTEVASMRERLGELSKEMVGVKGTSDGAIVDLFALLERVASIFVDISDLASPTYQLRPR